MLGYFGEASTWPFGVSLASRIESDRPTTQESAVLDRRLIKTASRLLMSRLSALEMLEAVLRYVHALGP